MQIGEAFISQGSGHVGVIEEIVPNPNGTYRVKFEDGKWTTVTP
jgi:membrane protein implicated in regulation of membrane protease activity